MKKLYIFFLCFLYSILNAQDYQNICSPGITFYKKQNLYFEALRQDSVHLAGSNDTIFYSYLTIRDSSGYCMDTTNGDALGRKVYKKHDGWFWFFNLRKDTIKLNSQATLNQSWKYCSLPGNCYLQATVTAIITDSVLGTTDQVKVISFQAKNASNSNIFSIFNQKKIKLSKHYGLSMVYDIYMTPVDTVNLILIGKTTPPLGVQPFNWSDVYNYDVGDEFHYYYYQTYNNETTVQSRTIDKILDKTVYGNIDSVRYQVEECKTIISAEPPHFTEYHDTVIEKYNFIQLSNDPTITMLPDEFDFFDYMASISRTYSDFHSRLVQIFNDCGYSPGWSGSHGCITGPFESWGPVSSYVPGLGLTNWLYEAADTYFEGYYNNLVYYKKGSETWGTPLAPNCSALVPVEETEKSIVPDILVIPNPVETVAEISLEGLRQSDLKYILVNSFGQQVLSGEIHSVHFIFNRSGMPGGLYIMTVLDDKSTVLARTKIILE
jgi:hypothetical protein